MMYGSLSYRHIMLLTASQDILYAPHHQWNLLDPVDFMKCYSFLCTLAGTTVTLRQELEGVDPQKVAQSVVSSPWHAVTPPTTAGPKKRKRSNVGDANISGARGPFVKGANSEGVDDLELEESNRWHVSMKEWQLERQRLDIQPGLPLKQHLVKLVKLVVYDGERLKSVDEWSANIGHHGAS
jgi:hypothetical protein